MHRHIRQYICQSDGKDDQGFTREPQNCKEAGDWAVTHWQQQNHD